MNNIEKLAIEHGAVKFNEYETLGSSGSEPVFIFETSELEAFAKALQQSSEPVAEVRCRNGEVFGYIPSRVLRDMLPLGTKLFTHPPATVPLEKYNRAIEALKCIDEDLVNPVYYRLVKEAIAEAEGKEG